MALEKSQVAMCNAALVRLGADRITAIDEDSENARKCNAVWDLTLEAVLGDHPWKFANKRAVLALATTTPASGFSYYLQLPADCIRALEVDDPKDAIWKREGDFIATDESSLKIRYTARISDPSKFSAGFIDALISRLIADLAYPITNSVSLASAKMEQYLKVDLPRAKSADSQQGSQDEYQSDEWLNARSAGASE